MSLLSTEEEADLAAEILDELSDTGSIYRPDPGTSGALGHTNTFTLIGIDSCKYAPSQRQLRETTEKIMAGGVELNQDIIVTFPAHTDVTERDRLVVTVTRTGEILDLEALGVKSRTNEFTRQVACKLYR